MAEQSDIPERAQRIVAAVLQAAPPLELQPEVKRGYLDQHMEPLLSLFTEVGQGLRRERAQASISTQPSGPSIGEQLKDYNFSIVSNSGKSSNVMIRALLHNPGVIPKFGITGLDDVAATAMREMAGADTWNLIYGHLPAAVDIVDAYLTRFLPS